MATIYDVAARCGVSASTVSYVLSGQGDRRRIAPATQARVRAAAEALGYTARRRRPGGAAGTPVIAVYWPRRDFEMCMPPLTQGLNNALSASPCAVNISIRPYDQGCLGALLEDQVPACDTMLFVAGQKDDLGWLESHPPAVPAVLLNRNLPGYSSVSVDHIQAARLATEHALRCGGTDVTMVMNTVDYYGLTSRSEHMAEILRAQGWTPEGRTLYCANRVDDGYDLGRELLRSGKLTRVILCAYDMVGLGILSALYEAGCEVGRDVQVLAVSTGPQRLFARSCPPMTVVDLRTREIMERCLTMAIDLAAGRQAEPRVLTVQPEIVFRQSAPQRALARQTVQEEGRPGPCRGGEEAPGDS
ncbi:MAG: LacI family transcriptional regulator [Oscillibacter sp.]|nr:LacI family transcriptional regulator [Oscillibacter sp.]